MDDVENFVNSLMVLTGQGKSPASLTPDPTEEKEEKAEDTEKATAEDAATTQTDSVTVDSIPSEGMGETGLWY